MMLDLCPRCAGDSFHLGFVDMSLYGGIKREAFVRCWLCRLTASGLPKIGGGYILAGIAPTTGPASDR